jgi:DNA-binding SARP family transcriptional activator
VLHLRTFGTLSLQTPEGASVGSLLAQTRSMALLVYLLLARPRGYLRRDTLCALFWPDADEEHARGALSQALTRIRRAAGHDIIEPRGRDEVRIASGAVACDVLAFEDALAAGRPDVALELYAGAFLSGFHAPHSPGFEGWAELERDRLRSLAAGAARTVAHENLAGGRLTEGLESAVRALALAPESEAVAEELVRSLWRAGNRSGALRLYDGWAAALGRELELEPSDRLQSLRRELLANAPPPGDQAQTAQSPTAQRRPLNAQGPAPPAPSVPPGSASPGRPRMGPSRRAATGTAASIALLLGGWALVQAGFLSASYPMKASGRAAVELTRGDWLLVADFEAPSTDPALALAFQTLLIRDVESAGYASVVGGIGALSRRGLEGVLARMRLPPDTRIDAELACQIAEREGAAGVLAGRVVPLGDEYVLAVSVLGGPDCRELIRASSVVTFQELSRGVAVVSRELRARLGESRASIRSSPPLPPMTAAYMEALHAVSHYLYAADLWDDEIRGAAQLLEAIRIEPDFAFAHFLLALHYQRLGRFDRAVPHVLRAHELRSQLPRPGRLGMEAVYDRYIASDPHAAMATVETIIAEYPAVADGTMPFLADAALWTGDWQRALDISLEHLGRAPVGIAAHLSLTRASTAAWALGRAGLADSLHRAAVRGQREAGLAADRKAALVHHLRGMDWEGAETLCAAHPGWDRCGHLYLARGKLDAAERSLQAALRDGTGAGSPWDRAAATAGLVRIERLRGRPDRAWDVLAQADWTLPMAGLARAGSQLNRFLLCAAAAELRRSHDLPECSIEGEDPAQWDADPSFAVILRSGAWSRRLLAVRSIERDEGEAGLRQAREAALSNFGNPGAVDHLIRALAFDALARPDSAIVHYIEATRIGRDACFPTAAGIAFPLAPVYRRIAELAEDAGDVTTALRFHDAFVRLWSHADPALQPQVRAATERIRWLAGTVAP